MVYAATVSCEWVGVVARGGDETGFVHAAFFPAAARGVSPTPLCSATFHLLVAWKLLQ